MYRLNTAVGLLLLGITLSLIGCESLESAKTAPSARSPASLRRSDYAPNHPKEDTAQVAKASVEYNFAKKQFTLHEPIILNFIIKNGFSQPIKLDLGQDYKESFLFTVNRPDGSQIRLPQYSVNGIALLGELSLKAEEVYTQKILLNEWFDFPETGRYEIQVRLAKPIQTQEGNEIGIVADTHISLEITPRDAEQFEERVCYPVKASRRR